MLWVLYRRCAIERTSKQNGPENSLVFPHRAVDAELSEAVLRMDAWPSPETSMTFPDIAGCASSNSDCGNVSPGDVKIAIENRQV